MKKIYPNLIRQCVVCGDIFGEKEPIHDKSVTHGYCPGCFKEEMKKLERRIAMKEKKNPFPSRRIAMKQKEYEERELREFFAQLKKIEKAPIGERREGYQTLVEAIRSKNGVQYLIDDVYGWMLNGSFGFGAYHWFWNIRAKLRTKVIMGFKVALMLNFLTDDRHVVKALKENIPDLEGLNKVLIEEMNKYKKEMNE